MPFPYLREQETSKTLSPRVGVCVYTADGKCYFFPGYPVGHAIILAVDALTKEVLEAPQTLIEIGEVAEGRWFLKRVLKPRAEGK